MIRDFFSIIMKSVAFMWESESSGIIAGAIIVAFILGVLCWVACSYYTRLWNKRFRVKFQHHLLCALAATLTVVFTLSFRAVRELEYIVDEIVDNWYEELEEDYFFHQETYTEAYYALKNMNPNAFIGVPEPDDAENTYLSFANSDMIEKCVEIYVRGACNNFSTQHPFLNLMLRARPGISKEEIKEDIQHFAYMNPGKRYPLENAIDIAAYYISEILYEQSPRTVWKSRIILFALFLFVQLIPFGVIGYSAYKDLKIGDYTYSYH